jgi:hypothetical protein
MKQLYLSNHSELDAFVYTLFYHNGRYYHLPKYQCFLLNDPVQSTPIHPSQKLDGSLNFIFMQVSITLLQFRAIPTCVETTHVPRHQHCWKGLWIFFWKAGSQMRWRGRWKYHWRYTLQQIYQLHFAVWLTTAKWSVVKWTRLFH